MNFCLGGFFSCLENDGIYSYYDKCWDGEVFNEEDNIIRFLLFVYLSGKQFCYDESEVLGGYNYVVVNLYRVSLVVYWVSYC